MMKRVRFLIWIAKKLNVFETLEDFFKDEIVRYESPIEELFELDDEKGKVYVWKAQKGRKEQLQAFMERIEEAFEEEYGRSTQAFHLAVEDVEEIQELTPKEFCEEVPEWVKDS